MSSLFKNYSLAKVTYLTIRLIRNSTDTNSVNKQNTHRQTTHSEKDKTEKRYLE